MSGLGRVFAPERCPERTDSLSPEAALALASANADGQEVQEEDPVP